MRSGVFLPSGALAKSDSSAEGRFTIGFSYMRCWASPEEWRHSWCWVEWAMWDCTRIVSVLLWFSLPSCLPPVFPLLSMRQGQMTQQPWLLPSRILLFISLYYFHWPSLFWTEALANVFGDYPCLKCIFETLQTSAWRHPVVRCSESCVPRCPYCLNHLHGATLLSSVHRQLAFPTFSISSAFTMDTHLRFFQVSLIAMNAVCNP